MTPVILEPIARHVDILAKGCYVNLVGRKRDRVWVRWSVEQTIEALEAAGRTDAIPLVMPELCRDPEEDHEIRAWVRHDVYLGLAQVFLFGERASTLQVQPTSAPAAETVRVGGDVEATTTSEQEREQREIEVPSWTAAEFVYNGGHWLWLINSANTPATFQLSGWPNELWVRDAFTGKEIDVETDSPWELTLPAYGVTAIRWTDGTSGAVKR